MTDVETPQPPTPTGRRCPRCGASMTDEQEWCLHCGAAVGTRVVAARGWRTPIAIAGAIALIAVIAVAIALVQLADDTDKVQAAAAPTAVPTAAPVAPTATPALPEASGLETPTPTATPTPTPGSTSSSGDAKWPSGKTGWTVVLASDSSKSAARSKADSFAQDGIAGVGLLHSDDFSSLKAGSWIVFSGEYDHQSQASDALDGVDVKDAYIRHIVPN